MYCECRDTPEHTLFICQKWENYRNELNFAIGTAVSKENIISIMISEEDYWNKITEFIIKIMTKKENDERLRQLNNQQQE